MKRSSSGYYALFTGILMMVFSPCSSQVAKEREVVLEEIVPQSRVVLNIPGNSHFSPERKTLIIFYALPNGNTIEQTQGRLITDEKEWRFDIQHIAAQTRFLRETDKEHNYLVVYLQSETGGWTSHAANYTNSGELYNHLIDSIRRYVISQYPAIVTEESTGTILASHSGGGRLILNFLLFNEQIPLHVKRIIFIDSNYGYQTTLHSSGIAKWLGYSNNHLQVMAYIDTTVILNGSPVVSSTGGTGYRSRLMAEDLIKYGFKLKSRRDTSFVSYSAKGIEILIKENNEGKIYHTVLVERNGLIHGVLKGTPYQNRGYRFWGDRAYEKYITK